MKRILHFKEARNIYKVNIFAANKEDLTLFIETILVMIHFYFLLQINKWNLKFNSNIYLSIWLSYFSAFVWSFGYIFFAHSLLPAQEPFSGVSGSLVRRSTRTIRAKLELSAATWPLRSPGSSILLQEVNHLFVRKT